MSMDVSAPEVRPETVGGLRQLFRYGVVGLASTGVQAAVFYILAATWLQCLTPEDPAVRFLGLPSVTLGDGLRAVRAAAATAVGFTLANVFCWVMNRLFVFRAGRHKWYVEFMLFYGAAAGATIIALGLQSVFIKYFGMWTTLALGIEVVASFVINFFVRKFFIFKG